ncbi:hypothetical protein LCM23_13120 [Cytobacillus kochii]|uniref:hypothetical protein n=1 Tax=Cytobacillus kochii TaxID=859143 RepID=UPI001CD6E7C6|nr:hypothetical protein [Cytobacillus kochii]MCA1027036.1 hypothetical protein [Cytobacillus kochii]
MGEIVVVNTKSSDLKHYNGFLAEIEELPKLNVNDFIVSIIDKDKNIIESVKMREEEVQRLRDSSIIHYREYEPVVYTPTNEIARINKIDYINEMVGLDFEDDGSIVVAPLTIKQVKNKKDIREQLAKHRYADGYYRIHEKQLEDILKQVDVIM